MRAKASLTDLRAPLRLRGFQSLIVTAGTRADEGRMKWFAVTFAGLCGLVIAWIDSRPGWDDTGITAGMLLLSAAVIALVAPRRVWRIALAVGAWIPMQAIVKSGAAPGSFAMLLVLLFPLAGAYGGLGIRTLTKARDAAAR